MKREQQALLVCIVLEPISTSDPGSGSQIAQARSYGGSDQSVMANSIQWANPCPDVEIRSLYLLPDKDKAEVLALLALTSATARLLSSYIV